MCWFESPFTNGTGLSVAAVKSPPRGSLRSHAVQTGVNFPAALSTMRWQTASVWLQRVHRAFNDESDPARPDLADGNNDGVVASAAAYFFALRLAPPPIVSGLRSWSRESRAHHNVNASHKRGNDTVSNVEEKIGFSKRCVQR